jgi:hypothetical protein
MFIIYSIIIFTILVSLYNNLENIKKSITNKQKRYKDLLSIGMNYLS